MFQHHHSLMGTDFISLSCLIIRAIRWLFVFVCYFLLVDVIFFVVPVVYCARMSSIQKLNQ